MEPNLSLSDKFLIAAKSYGYTANKDGDVFSPTGKKLSNRSVKKHGHISITLRVPGVNDRGFQSVLAHRFVAYFFHGDEIFKHQCVRHLDDVPARNVAVNLMPGSTKENRADIPREVLSANALKNAHLLVARSRKLSDQDILAMRMERESSGAPYKDIAEAYGVSAMTAYRAINKQSWKEVSNEG